MSRPKKPIVFYFDPGIPPEIRHAMKAGLLGWNKAFEKAGFIEAIEARDAPAEMVMAKSWDASAGTGEEAALRRVTQKVVLDAMMIMGSKTDGSETARAYMLDTLARLGASLDKRRANDALTAAFYRQSARDIARYLDDPAGNAPRSATSTWGGFPRSRFPMPPGPPLG